MAARVLRRALALGDDRAIGILTLLGSAFPLALRLIHVGWMWHGHLLGWINTRDLLSIVLYLSLKGSEE